MKPLILRLWLYLLLLTIKMAERRIERLLFKSFALLLIYLAFRGENMAENQ